MQLVDDFRSCWRMFSFQGASALAVIQAALLADPRVFDFLPERWRHALLLAVALYAAAGRVVKQTPAAPVQVGS